MSSQSRVEIYGQAPFKQSGVYEAQIAITDSKPSDDSIKTKQLIRNKIINFNFLLSAGDDYELLFTAQSRNSSTISRLAKNNNIKITKVGKIIEKRGLYLDGQKIKIVYKSFQHFF